MTARPAHPPTTPPAIVPGGAGVPLPPPLPAAVEVLLMVSCVEVAGACCVSFGPVMKFTEVAVLCCCEDCCVSEDSSDVCVVLRDDSSSSRFRLEEGAMVDTRPSGKVVVNGSSERVMVTTSPLGSVAKNTPGPRDARLELDEPDALDDRVVSVWQSQHQFPLLVPIASLTYSSRVANRRA